MPLTAQQNFLRASIAAHTPMVRRSSAANAARGQAGLFAKFEREARAADHPARCRGNPPRPVGLPGAHGPAVTRPAPRPALPARPVVTVPPPDRPRGRPLHKDSPSHHSSTTADEKLGRG